MRTRSLASIALVLTMSACGGGSSHQDPAPQSRPHGSQSVVGRWALVTLIRNGQDRTHRAGTSADEVVYYTFNAGGNFRIELADSVVETGTWSADTTVLPKIFDHIPDLNGSPGPYVPGIYAIDGNTLRISILPPNPSNRHPTRFESTAADSSWLLVFKRAAQSQ
jgi:uncharacterized protein (TIGR03067 family)